MIVFGDRLQKVQVAKDQIGLADNAQREILPRGEDFKNAARDFVATLRRAGRDRWRCQWR